MPPSRQLVLLLRGINVGGHRKLPMAELRQLATDLGYDDARTYIQSGNLIVRTDEAVDAVAGAVHAGIAERFGHDDVAVVVRTEAQWRALAETPAFPDAWEERPRFLHVGFAAEDAPAEAEATLRGYAREGERVRVDGDTVWLDLVHGAGRTKITPARLDRAFGTPVTCRNARSILKIRDLLDP